MDGQRDRGVIMSGTNVQSPRRHIPSVQHGTARGISSYFVLFILSRKITMVVPGDGFQGVGEGILRYVVQSAHVEITVPVTITTEKN